MKRSFIRAVAAALVGAGGALAQSPLPGVSTDARPEARATAPAGRATSVTEKGTVASVFAEMMPARASNGHATTSAAAGHGREGTLLPAGCLDSNGGPSYTFWAGAEYVLWDIRDGSIPNLTARPPIGVLQVTARDFERTRNAAGVLISDFVPVAVTQGFFPVQIQVIPTIPDGPVNLGNHSGVRFNAGAWLTPDHMLGVEAGAYFLGNRTARFNNTATNADGQLIFQTPFADRFFEVAQQTPPAPAIRTLLNTVPIFFVRQASSELAGAYTTNSWGAELNVRSSYVTVGGVTVGGMAGLRYVSFYEDFDLDGRFSLFRPTNLPPVSGDDPMRGGGNLPQRLDIVTRDTILTKNHFYGGQVGLDIEGSCYGFFVSVRPRIALGGVHNVVKILGSTTTLTNGVVSNTSSGGLLFTPLDVGRIRRDRITIIPELNVKGGYQFTPWLRGFVGYDIMSFVNMVRPGDVSVASSTTTQITTAPAAGSGGGAAATTVVNVTQPTFRFRETDVLIQGFNFGLELRY